MGQCGVLGDRLAFESGNQDLNPAPPLQDCQSQYLPHALVKNHPESTGKVLALSLALKPLQVSSVKWV